MSKRLHLLALFYRSFGFYLWLVSILAWCALRMPTGRDLGVALPALMLFKLFLQGTTLYIFRSRYRHLFFFYANANLSRLELFITAFVIDFVVFLLTMVIIQLASGWIR